MSPDVTVLLDPGDDAVITRAALAAHDPAAGHITLRPTSGTTSDRYFAHDRLAALGKPAHRVRHVVASPSDKLPDRR
ncbi:hypothetical protein ACH47Z_39400 [Streptomyces sp. NPDC020192]|uniref:hypothetical protein n=1 Tax=Streptomyces sp. NPDC020192 TaxID=3365066 RepID=UPI0037A57664